MRNQYKKLISRCFLLANILIFWDCTSNNNQSENRLFFKELNPRIEIITFNENINEQSVQKIVSSADIIVDYTPLFKKVLFGRPLKFLIISWFFVCCCLIYLRIKITLTKATIKAIRFNRNISYYTHYVY